MADDLVDIGKFKVTQATNALLEQRMRRSGKKQSKQAIARQLLHEIAVNEIEDARLLIALSPAEGNSGEVRGRRR